MQGDFSKRFTSDLLGYHELAVKYLHVIYLKTSFGTIRTHYQNVWCIDTGSNERIDVIMT